MRLRSAKLGGSSGYVMQRSAQNQNLRQTQNVMLSPQMRLAMRVLESAQLDLAEIIQSEIEQNPLIEIDMADDRDLPTALSANNEPDHQADGSLEADQAVSVQDDYDLDYIREENEWAALRDHGEDGWRPREPSVAPTAREHIVQAIFDQSYPAAITDLAVMLVHWLDEAGFLREADGELAQALNADVDMIADARACLQAVEPAGLGARDLCECFTLQLQRRGGVTPKMAQVIAHLDLLLRCSVEAMAQELDMAPLEVKDHLSQLRHLTARPLDRLDVTPDERPAPDLRIFNQRGQWVAEINEDFLPSIHLREDYWQELARLDQQAQLHRYLRQHRQSARWLQRTINTRAMSLLRVSNAIIARQTDYLAQGASALRPMTIRQIAEDVGLNEGTVSRVVANKIVETPFGVMPLRQLFTSAVGADDQGEAFASGAVKFRIKALIDAEPDKKPLSDARLVKILEEEGISVARRTVTKYREALGLASSVDRKRTNGLML